MARLAREENETLKARVAAFEARLAGGNRRLRNRRRHLEGERTALRPQSRLRPGISRN